MEFDISALQELPATEFLGAASPAGCCAAMSVVTCPKCTFLCSAGCPP
ncbi:ALQxL family class IV lanthipeptide [Amycolatopsis antarctica]